MSYHPVTPFADDHTNRRLTIRAAIFLATVARAIVTSVAANRARSECRSGVNQV